MMVTFWSTLQPSKPQNSLQSTTSILIIFFPKRSPKEHHKNLYKDYENKMMQGIFLKINTYPSLINPKGAILVLDLEE